MAGEYINDEAFDQGLDYIIAQNDCRIDITSQVATNYSEATTEDTHSVGFKAGLTVGATEAADVDGRKVVVPEITNGEVTVTDTATHWALTDGAAILLATGELTSSQAVTDGNSFSLDAIDIIHRDATAVA